MIEQRVVQSVIKTHAFQNHALNLEFACRKFSPDCGVHLGSICFGRQRNINNSIP